MINRQPPIPPLKSSRGQEGRSSPTEAPSLLTFPGILNNSIPHSAVGHKAVLSSDRRQCITFIDLKNNNHLSDKVIVQSTVLKPEKHTRIRR